MSGGSFNYLCFKVTDASDVFRYTDEVEHMVKYLKNIGKHDAAREVLKYQLFLSAMQSRIEAYGEWIEPLLKSVEWECSGDRGLDAIDRAYEELLGARFQPSTDNADGGE